ncbi:hypothetical protein CKA32_001137 [Geitlerinema sp. FC II]|nr:hypothetical protein CKA32_001137 [Geitlerinema sp. FC II]
MYFLKLKIFRFRRTTVRSRPSDSEISLTWEAIAFYRARF